ncbi:unnamed protein product [Closterium sp. NIES-54]
MICHKFLNHPHPDPVPFPAISLCLQVDQLAAACAEYKGEKVEPPERTASMPTEEEQSKEDILRDIVRSQSHRSLKSRTPGGNSYENLAGVVGSVATGVAKITVEESTNA